MQTILTKAIALILMTITCSLNVIGQPTDFYEDRHYRPYLTQSDIDTLENITGLKYDIIRQDYHVNLSPERIMTFESRLAESVANSGADSLYIVLSDRDAYIVEYINNVFNLPWSAAQSTFHGWTDNIIDQPDEYLNRDLAQIMLKWLPDNIRYLINHSLLEKYIDFASKAQFDSMAHKILWPWLQSSNLPMWKNEYYCDLILKTSFYLRKIEELMIEYYTLKISDENPHNR